ncbi:RagB/SusD family nutrient uptake outer membrane protein [Niastella populi]|uniref:Carbohydrate-binding protein SusD n=1 Tax=Niastella populi TaxID=550983 RepID=A0A1V9FL78_9BACT|nr:RagB/SusD family nutrient uptake outer membrane protein [Niastella populi]OQP58976.1 hypothetical protein A4R26_21540 [Niastella populi]
MNRQFYNLLPGFLIASCCIIIISCKKLVNPGVPANRTTSEKVYNNDTLAREAVVGIYREIMKSFGPLHGQITWLCAIYSDELTQPDIMKEYEPFLTNTLRADNPTVQAIWTKLYSTLYQCNDVIEGLKNSSLSDSIRNQLSGEAYFLRALNYYYLVNLFGKVPLITITDFAANAKMGRTEIHRIYDQIISDLQDAQHLLTYFTSVDKPYQRVRANSFAASALLARAYLYKKDWAAAEKAATQLIESHYYNLESNVLQVFLSDSKEAILQFLPFTIYNSAEGATFIPQTGKPPTFNIHRSLLNAFETNDKRREWVNNTTYNGSKYYYPYKYKQNNGAPYTEYNMVLRLAEQYLIRAEARIMQNNLTGAAIDLNKIRTRSGLAPIAGFSSEHAAMLALEQERRIELFAEWGHRWFDLNRFEAHTLPGNFVNRADEVLDTFKPEWETTALQWPIPGKEVNLNPALIQNKGY